MEMIKSQKTRTIPPRWRQCVVMWFQVYTLSLLLGWVLSQLLLYRQLTSLPLKLMMTNTIIMSITIQYVITMPYAIKLAKRIKFLPT